MALIIRSHHRSAFSSLLDEMYQLRRRVFVERLGWKLDTDGIREIDQFDNGGCMHLVAFDPAGRVRATSRYTPSMEPNVTCDVLQDRMKCAFPRGPHIVEVTRHCVDPELDDATRKEVLLDMRVSQLELAHRHGWTHSLGVSYDRHIQPWIRVGMQVEVLGSPFLFPGDKEFSFAWMVSQNAEKPNAILDFLGADTGRLQDPDENPELLIRLGDRLRLPA